MIQTHHSASEQRRVHELRGVMRILSHACIACGVPSTYNAFRPPAADSEPSRMPRHVAARRVAAALLREHGLSCADITAALGYSSRGSVARLIRLAHTQHAEELAAARGTISQ